MTDLTDHWRKAFDNKFLGAWNLFRNGQYVTATVTIERITRETVTMQGGRRNQATLVHFAGKKTPMILTKTMGKVIQGMYGPSPKEWIGKSITLYVERGVRVQEGTGDVLRVRNEKAGRGLKEDMVAPPHDEGPPEEFGGEST